MICLVHDAEFWYDQYLSTSYSEPTKQLAASYDKP